MSENKIYNKNQPKIIWFVSILWLFVISFIAFLWNLGSTGLVDETEPLFAEAARQMTVTGDWITPYFNGATRFDKPPLIYWLMVIAYKLVGVNAWGVRLPSALAAISLMVLLFYTLWRHSGETRGRGEQGVAANGHSPLQGLGDQEGDRKNQGRGGPGRGRGDQGRRGPGDSQSPSHPAKALTPVPSIPPTPL
ncbi:ArnT family glycosyltransferase [[Phormidium] sp. ETS-05]|uniref:ArnT family glycosyltransferase n=1 Tax=[Phormidium] sp. ETS-05 TaxID=222819 RepID=UPI0035C90ABD